jgi:amidohydrolase
MKKLAKLLFALLFVQITFAQQQIDKQIANIEKKVIEWRHELHQNPELSNREFKTAEKIEAHLRSLGIEVQTGVGKQVL